MGTVRLRFSPSPAHVRTARLVAATIARRVGLPEPVVEEVRLAVGEACTIAVRRQAAHDPTVPVELTIDDGPPRLRVVVSDSVAEGVELPGTGSGGNGGEYGNGFDDLGITVLEELAEDLTVAHGPTGSRLSLSWPVPRG